VNLYDDVRPDVPALLAAQARTLRPPDPAARSGDGLGPLGRLASLARLYWLGLQVRTGRHRRLVYANHRLDWFYEFQAYWTDALGNRPIHPHDFYHLYGVYRQRLQSVVPDLGSDAAHLEAWRDPSIVYYLFAHTFRQALQPLHVHRYARFIARGARVAEYGCGTAPMLTALARRYRHRNLALVGADIPHLLFHFARWRFRGDRFVTLVPIEPADDAPLPGRYDVIFCLEVFEHLPRPLATLRHFAGALNPGGVLIFDYVRSEGAGLDTAAALRDRDAALAFVLERFHVVDGHVPTDGSHVQPAVVRLRA
jgi:2-polyprenyl-3-methyl-5-hydroxy-6-metoxy-1,4-benzoquinol methylase